MERCRVRWATGGSKMARNEIFRTYAEKGSSAVLMKKKKKRNLQVVVAEKNSENRLSLCNLVSSLNCVALPTSSGLDALTEINHGQVALVLLDLDLVFSEGENILQKIRQVAPMLPIVILSHMMTPALARRLGDRGAQSFLMKPVQRDQLAVTLFRYLL